MGNALIQVNNLKKNYQQRTILDDLSFAITPGTFTTLLGANGSGKSTLLRLISGSEHADSGSVLFKQSPVHNWNLPHKQDLFYINENIQIESSHTVGEFAHQFSRFFPRWHQEYFSQMVLERRIPLEAYYHQLSRGQKMQFNLMLALAARPEVLLLDEITSVMDVYARRYFLSMLHRFCQSGKTVIMTTNIISELEFYTTHLLLLQQGRLKLQGPLGDLRHAFIKLRFPHESNHPLLKRTDLRWAGMNGDGSENFLLSKEAAISLDIDSSLLSLSEITLEDIFIYHYSEAMVNDEYAA